MHTQLFKAIRIYTTLLVVIFIWSLLLWEKFHGGVVTHHILQRSDLPGISNWWGLALLPFLSWLTFFKMQKRVYQSTEEKAQKTTFRNCIIGFLGALVFGIVLASAFSNGYTNFLNYQVDSLLLLFFLVPIYRSEYLLGFILGMTTAIGAVLPTAFALIVAIPSVLIYVYIRPFLIKTFHAIFKKKQ